MVSVLLLQNVEQIVRFLKVEKYSPMKTRFLHLQPCGHVVEVNHMDKWVESSTPTPPSSPQFVTCPICKQMVGLCPRYLHTIPSSCRCVNDLVGRTCNSFDIVLNLSVQHS